jgi:general secretion pathway protein C
MRLVLDARARALLRRLPRTNVYSTLELLLLAGLAVQCARLFWVLATPVSPLGPWQPVQPGFAGSPAAMLQGFDPFFRLSGGDGKPSVVTSLQLTLFGTRTNDATGGGSAIIAGPDGVQTSFAVGDEISPGVKLKAVAFDHVTIDRGGAAEDLFIDQSGTVVPVVPVPVAASPSLLGPSPSSTMGRGMSPAQFRTDIGFIPRVDGGRVSGLTVRPIGSGAAFRAAGVHEGDVITAIGGRPVTGQGDFEQLAASVGKGGSVPVTVERGNQTLSLTITIAGQ